MLWLFNAVTYYDFKTFTMRNNAFNYRFDIRELKSFSK